MIMDGFVLFPGTNIYVPPESTSHEMYFLVVILHLKATSSPLSILVFMSQIVVYATKLNVPLHMYIDVQPSGNMTVEAECDTDTLAEWLTNSDYQQEL